LTTHTSATTDAVAEETHSGKPVPRRDRVVHAQDVPVVILCGGQGTRIREASERLPKPMIEIGERPVLWHIMKTYHHYGHRRFVLCLGFKAWTIKEFFLNYREQTSDITVFADGTVETHNTPNGDDWEVTLIETGLESDTGRRLSLAREHLRCEYFMLTYGDGVADVDLGALLREHVRSGRVGTVTAVHPTSRFGELCLDGNIVTNFAEKPELQSGLVNGGFFAFRHDFLDYVHDDSAMLERDALQKLTVDGQLGIRKHTGFWRGMDTYREYVELNELWNTGEAPWKVWS
jgi:glucose-1-phosphate cytidylyltransferase